MHFAVSTDIAWRYVTDGVEVLAERAPTFTEAPAAAGEGRRLPLDGTRIPTWRCGAQATESIPHSLYSGKYHEHGVNASVMRGRFDLRRGGRPRRQDHRSRSVRMSVKRPTGKGHNGWEEQANSALDELRAPSERAFAVLKRWRVLGTVWISTNRIKL